MNRKLNKLSFKKETVRNLVDAELAGAAGGSTSTGDSEDVCCARPGDSLLGCVIVLNPATPVINPPIIRPRGL